MSELRIEMFVNEFGQEILPGEEVVYAGTAWKNTTFRKGKFGGVYYNSVNRPVRKEDGKWGYETAVIPTAVKVYDVPARLYKWDNVKRQGHYEDGFRTACLPLKRVFKLDMTMSQFATKEYYV